nr:NlpC/P60 family protein [uncultured Roseateles sp.]
MSEQTEREAVATEARPWFGTPYHHHGRIRGVGVDCAQILMAVYCDALHLAPALDVGRYSTQWHLHRGEEVYLDWLTKAGAHEVQAPAKGDIAMFRFGRTFSHSAICLDGIDGQFIHAYVDRGVILSRLNEDPLQGREVKFWSLW